MRKNRVDVITMGCSKNLIDSERLMRQFAESGYTVCHNPERVEQRAEAIAQLKAVRDELIELRQLIEQIERYTSASEVRDRLRQEGLL